MKKIKYCLLALTISLGACKKETPTPADATPALVNVSSAPSSFKQKVLIEELTGAWCGYCPGGARTIEELQTANGDLVVAASVHTGQGEVMALQDFTKELWDTLRFTNDNGVPSGLINRIAYNDIVIMNSGYFESRAKACLKMTAKCGLAIEGKKLSGNTVSVVVHAAFKQALTGNYNLTIYLTEDNVTGGTAYDQHNYLSKTGSSPDPQNYYYNFPPTITGFHHMNVLREILTADFGDAIPANKLVAGGEFVLTKTVDISGKNCDNPNTTYNVANLKIVAFVNLVGTTPTNSQVMNVQEAKFYSGQLTGKNWD